MAICVHWRCNEKEGGGERKKKKEKKKNHPSGLPSNPRPQSLFVCMSLDSSNLVSASGLFDLVAPLAVAACVTLWMMKTGSGGGGGVGWGGGQIHISGLLRRAGHKQALFCCLSARLG